uniref:Uncharacterized protein n=1 Tax=Plectus sambesii TaxID=2011161 RepID=A0A914UPJ0_9BILA
MEDLHRYPVSHSQCINWCSERLAGGPFPMIMNHVDVLSETALIRSISYVLSSNTPVEECCLPAYGQYPPLIGFLAWTLSGVLILSSNTPVEECCLPAYGQYPPLIGFLAWTLSGVLKF